MKWPFRKRRLGVEWPLCEYLVCDDHKILFCPIPKVACTTLKIAIWAATHPHPIPPDDPHGFIKRQLGLHRYNGRRANEIVRSSKYFKFTFVRNPWSRLVSGFLNKFVNRLKPPGLQIINKLRISSNSIRFRNFVYFLQSEDASKFDRHWRPQVKYLGNTPFDFIGKFEHLQEDFSLVARRLSLNPQLEHRNRTEYAFGNTECVADFTAAKLNDLQAFPPYQFFYTPELIEIVGKIYSGDIEAFGYDFGEQSFSTRPLKKAG